MEPFIKCQTKLNYFDEWLIKLDKLMCNVCVLFSTYLKYKKKYVLVRACSRRDAEERNSSRGENSENLVNSDQVSCSRRGESEKERRRMRRNAHYSERRDNTVLDEICQPQFEV